MLLFTKRLWYPLRAVIVGILGAWLAILAVNGIQGHFAFVTARAAFYPAISGQTVLQLPPMGTISAETHKAPVRLSLVLEQVHLDEMVDWIADSKSFPHAENELRQNLYQIGVRLVERTLLVGILGALAAAFLLGRGRRIAAITGSLSVVVPIAIFAATFNVKAFANPKYDGEMSRAPDVLNIAGDVQSGYADLMGGMPRIADRVVSLYREIGNTATESGTHRSVMVISDLHNNPIALRLVQDLAKSYGVGMVLVAGDVTDLGHPLEAGMLKAWRHFDVPVIVVTGNHDSRSVVRTLSDVPNVTVLEDGKVVKQDGLTIMGFSDPASMREGVGRVDDTQAELDHLRGSILKRLHTESPDILMVHNYRVAKKLAGRVPLIVTGHSHSANIRTSHGGVVVNPGTTGAAGLRYFTDSKKLAYTAAILQFGSGLKSIDMVEFDMPSGDFRISRQSIPAD